MKIYLNGFRGVLLIAALSIFTMSSCKKKNGPGDDPDPNTPTQLSDADSLKYFTYQLMQKTIYKDGRDNTTHLPLYYWYKKVPAIDPLSSEFATATDLLNKMKSYTTADNGEVLDRYSFLDDGTVMSEIEGNAGDIGMQALYARFSTNEILPVVIYADKNSPAGKAGVKRGWVIMSVNNQSTQYDGSNGPNLTRVVNALYNDDQATFTFAKGDGTTTNITLAKAEYLLNPVLFDTVYNVDGKNVGYFAFSTFSDVASKNGTPTLTRNEIDRVFNSFASKNISSLVVDLRYNGGGEVRTMQYLANKIAPATSNGKLMYTTDYNDLLGAQLAREGAQNTVKFNGGGNLNLNNVFFIGSERTASASELLINNLKPYMNVMLVGDTTYGKPVGSWVYPINIFKNNTEKFLAYLVAITFETKNANGVGGYFHGLNPDVAAYDYIDIDWGDNRDDHLKKIFNYVSTGSFGRYRMLGAPDPSMQIPTDAKMPSLRFDGMIDRNATKNLK